VRLVLDTVGFVRALIYPEGPWGAILFEKAPEYTLLLSDELEAEIRDVLARPFLRQKLGSLFDLQARNVLAVLAFAEHVVLNDIPTVSRDCNDDHVVATAVEGNADYLVTDDRDLLDLGAWKGVQIVSGVEMIRYLRSLESSD
jgi:putative PIN family toxin of toxin-antitoxin system